VIFVIKVIDMIIEEMYKALRDKVKKKDLKDLIIAGSCGAALSISLLLWLWLLLWLLFWMLLFWMLVDFTTGLVDFTTGGVTIAFVGSTIVFGIVIYILDYKCKKKIKVNIELIRVISIILLVIVLLTCVFSYLMICAHEEMLVDFTTGVYWKSTIVFAGIVFGTVIYILYYKCKKKMRVNFKLLSLILSTQLSVTALAIYISLYFMMYVAVEIIEEILKNTNVQ
jgi:hypothetical protein